MATQLHVRDFRPADADAVNRVALAAFRQYERDYDDWDGLAASVGNMAALADQGDIIVATCAGEIAGAVGYFGPAQPKPPYLPQDQAAIRLLVVDPDQRGLGIGRALTDECLRRARRDRCQAIALHTSPIMTVALAMYLRLGFEMQGDAGEIDIRGVPYAVYVKSL